MKTQADPRDLVGGVEINGVPVQVAAHERGVQLHVNGIVVKGLADLTIGEAHDLASLLLTAVARAADDEVEMSSDGSFLQMLREDPRFRAVLRRSRR